MNCSMPGFPFHHQLLELVQIHGQWVGDVIQPSHPLSFPSLPASYISQHQDLLQWVRLSHQVDVQAGIKKGRGTKDQIANICWIIEKAREFQKNIYFCFIDYAKAFDCVDHNKLWKILKEMGMPDHLTCLLRNLHAGQEATVRTGHGIMDCF